MNLIALSIPSMTEHIMNTLLQYVDTAMVGRIGARASAAVSTTTTINWFIHSFPYAIGVAVLALVSREYGAKREGEAKKIVGSSFYLSLIFGGLITIISYSISGIMMVIFAYKQKFIRWSIEDMRADKDVLLKIFNIAFPTALNTGASCFGYVVFAGLVSSMGAVVFAAHSIAVTAEELFYIPGYGLRTASSSLIGNAIGEGNINKKTHNGRDEYFLYNFYDAGKWCVVIFSVDTYNVHFSTNSDVIRLGAKMLRLISFTEPFFGVMIAIESIYYGMGRTKEIFYVETIGMWCIRIVSTYVVVRVLNLGLNEVWYCMIADNVFKASALFVIYKIHKKKNDI